jgi:hypothetical protein
MKTARYVTVLSAAVFPLAIVLLAQGTGCKKDDPEPPPAPPPVTAPPAATPSTPTQVAPEDPNADAGSDASDASDAHHPTGVGGDPTGVRKCCAALRGNMKTAPPDQQVALGIAAGMCDGMVNNPQGRQALATLRGVLKGANMPGACQ